MKISEKKIAIVLAGVGVVCLLLTYVYYFMPKQEETAALEAENTNLSSRITQLETYAQNVDKYQDDTVKMIGDINEVIAKFPPDSLKEDDILYVLELESRNEKTMINSITLPGAELIYEIPTTTVPLNQKEADEGASHNFRLYRRQVSVANQFTYNGMKQFVTDIVSNQDVRNIDSMNFAYDENSGMLTGNSIINIYTLQGTDKEYKPQVITNVPLGTGNVFGTIEVPSTSTTAEED